MRPRHLVHSFVILVFASLAAPVAAAEPLGSPSSFVAEIARKAPIFMNSSALSSGDRRRQVEGLLQENFDMPRIARVILGNYWRTANVAHQREFITVLRAVLAFTYSDRFTRYNVESFRVVSQRELDAANTVVYTEINDPVLEEQTKLEWLVARRDGYRIIDIIVSGTSMTRLMHDDFGSYLQRNDGDLSKLIHELRAKLNAGPPD